MGMSRCGTVLNSSSGASLYWTPLQLALNDKSVGRLHTRESRDSLFLVCSLSELPNSSSDPTGGAFPRCLPLPLPTIGFPDSARGLLFSGTAAVPSPPVLSPPKLLPGAAFGTPTARLSSSALCWRSASSFSILEMANVSFNTAHGCQLLPCIWERRRASIFDCVPSGTARFRIIFHV